MKGNIDLQGLAAEIEAIQLRTRDTIRHALSEECAEKVLEELENANGNPVPML